MPDTFPASRQSDLKLSEQIRALRREIADTRTKRRGLDIALATRMNALARLEAQQAISLPGPARLAMACS